MTRVKERAYRIGGRSLAIKHGSSRSVESALLPSRTILQNRDDLKILSDYRRWVLRSCIYAQFPEW